MYRQRKYLHDGIGPGGWGCACCMPAPPGPKLAKWMRSRKRSERQEAAKEVRETLVDMERNGHEALAG